MNEFVSWCRHLLVPFVFHALSSLHPPSFHRNDFSTCINCACYADRWSLIPQWNLNYILDTKAQLKIPHLLQFVVLTVSKLYMSSC